MKRGYDAKNCSYSRLLLAAFVVTLLLDMGGGPVFIVFAILNLNKNTSIPAATWLLVRFYSFYSYRNRFEEYSIAFSLLLL